MLFIDKDKAEKIKSQKACIYVDFEFLRRHIPRGVICLREALLKSQDLRLLNLEIESSIPAIWLWMEEV